VTWREDPRLRVLGNRLLRIFEPKKDEVIRGRRKLHYEELHNVYSSQSIIISLKLWRVVWPGHVARMRAKRNAYKILVGNRKKEATRKTKT
jgi:hypothetical protein